MEKYADKILGTTGESNRKVIRKIRIDGDLAIDLT